MSNMKLYVPYRPQLPVPVMLAISMAGLVVPAISVLKFYSMDAILFALAIGLFGLVVGVVISLRLAGVKMMFGNLDEVVEGSYITINPRYFFAIILFVLLILPKMYDLAVAQAQALDTLHHYDQIAERSINHKKYMSEFIECWWKPFGKAQACVAEMQGKYASSENKEIVDSVLRDAELIK